MSNEIEETKAPGQSSLLPWMFGALILLPILYVVSIGPVAGLATAMGIQPEPLKSFYMPVIWLHDHTVLKEPLEKWVELFGGR